VLIGTEVGVLRMNELRDVPDGGTVA